MHSCNWRRTVHSLFYFLQICPACVFCVCVCVHARVHACAGVCFVFYFMDFSWKAYIYVLIQFQVHGAWLPPWFANHLVRCQVDQ